MCMHTRVCAAENQATRRGAPGSARIFVWLVFGVSVRFQAGGLGFRGRGVRMNCRLEQHKVYAPAHSFTAGKPDSQGW